MKKNKKWAVLLLLLVFISVFSVVTLWLLSYYHNVTNKYYTSYKKLQASNYAVEWIEMVKWYVSTQLNNDRINGWKNSIQPLSGKYVFWFNGWYTIDPKDDEIIEIDEPYVVDYQRVIEIYQWDSPDEKKVTVTVDYWERSKVSYETTLVNLYWK